MLRIEPFTFKHLSATVQLINTIARQAKSPMTTFETEQRQLATLPGRNFETDRFLAFEDERLVGYGDVWRSPGTPAADVSIGVHPDKRLGGIGKQLFEKVVARATTLKASGLIAFADPVHIGADTFLQTLGFEHISAYRTLQHNALDTLPRANPPNTYTLRSYAEGGSPVLLERLLREGYTDLPGHKVPLAHQIEKLVAHYDPAGILVLFDADEAVGCVLAEVHEAGAQVSSPALVPAYRSPGTYRLLCLAGLGYLHQQDATNAELRSWGDDPSTIRAFQNLGFRLIKEVPMYKLELA